jgi:lysophospholipase L1-like esterase
MRGLETMAQPPHSAVRDPRGTWKRRLMRVGLLAVVVGLCLLTLEGLTRLIYNRNGMHFGIEMWKYAKALKRTSPNPEMGHEHIPNSEAFLMGVPVKISSAGLRDREFSLEKPKGVYRILVLGDSITFGWGVPQDKTFSKLLEQSLNKEPPPGRTGPFEVINTGVGNYNTAQEVAFFKERGQLYKPDMVLLAFFINDAEETPREERNWLARESCLYVFASSAWDGILRGFGSRPAYKDYYLGLYQDDKPGWIACKKALKELMSTCKKDHIDLRIVLMPELHKFGADYEFQKVHEAVRELAKEGGVASIDLLNCLSGQDPPSLWVSPGDPHPNERANELFSKELRATLVPSLARTEKQSMTNPKRPVGN